MDVLHKIRVPNSYKAGCRFYGDFGWIDLPICDFDGVAQGNPISRGILEVAEDIIRQSAKPPEYTLPSSQAAADLRLLTWESDVPFVQELGNAARVITSFASATAQAFVDPWALAGAVEFVGQVLTNDFETKILTFVPEGKWPNGFDRENNVVALNERIKIERDKVVQKRVPESRETLNNFLVEVGKLILLNSDDLKAAKELVDDTPDMFEMTTVKRTTVRTEVDIPSSTDPTLKRTPAPSRPIPKRLTCLQNLIREQDNLKKLQLDIENSIRQLNGVPPNPADYDVTIPKQVEKEIAAVIGKRGGTPALNADEIKIRDSLTFRAVNTGKLASITPLNDAEKAILKDLNTRTELAKAPQDVVLEPARTVVTNQQAINEAIELRRARSAELEIARAEYASNQARRQALIEQLKDARVDAKRVAEKLNEETLKNLQTQLENDQALKTFKDDMHRYSAQTKQSLDDYKRAIAEQKIAARKFENAPTREAARLRAEFQTANAKVGSTRLVWENNKAILETKIEIFETRMMASPTFRTYILDLMPPSIHNLYNRITNFSINVTSQIEISFRAIIRKINPVSRINMTIAKILTDDPRLQSIIQLSLKQRQRAAKQRGKRVGKLLLGGGMMAVGIIFTAGQTTMFGPTTRIGQEEPAKNPMNFF
jgi:hypothetical protein